MGAALLLALVGLGRKDADPLLARGDLGALLALESPPEGDGALALLFTATLCDGCKETGFLTVQQSMTTVTKKGKKEVKLVNLVTHAVLPSDQREAFSARLTPPAKAVG